MSDNKRKFDAISGDLPAPLGAAFQPALAKFCRVEPALTLDELTEIKDLLVKHGALNFEKAKVKDAAGNPTGTFSASAANATGDHSESSMCGSWFRDNALIAYGLYLTDPNGKGAEPTWMDRPHIRFIGATGLEDPKWYNHKQNDALGYFLFTRCTLALAGKMPVTGDHLKLMGQLFDFLRTIESWDDFDGGHWEEHSAQHASSIGPCLAAVRLFKQLCKKEGWLAPCKHDTLDLLESKLKTNLDKILPNEIISPEEQKRDADAALIFLCYPLAVVDDDTGLKILDRLKKVYGHIGVCRYRSDSYWCRDYKDTQDDPTKHFTDEELKARDALLKPGEEAQWCLFDPMVSAYYGKLYQKSKKVEYLKLQQLFLSRALAAITGDDCEFGSWHACEAYYLCKGKWVSNDNTPLVWTQADLVMALHEMKNSVNVSAK